MERWSLGDPHPAQLAILLSWRRFLYYRGGLGAGKTWTLAQWAAANVLCHSPGVTGLLLSPTYTMSDTVVRAELERQWPKAVLETWHGSERSYTWPNGSKVYLRSAEHPGRFRGIEIGWAGLDEPSEMKAAIWPVITGRLRAKTRYRHQVLLTGTPSGFNWVHDAFGEPGERLAEGYHVVTASSEDNEHNLPEGYIDSLRSLYSARLAAQELDGSVVHLDGQVFTEYSPDAHMVDLSWPEQAETWAGVDFGYRRPAVTFWRRHPEQPSAWVCFDELHPSDCTTEALAERILAKGYRLTAAWCDPAGKAATTAGRSDVEALRRAGVPARYSTATKVRRIAYGLEVMRAAMAPADGSPPRFYVHRRLAQGGPRGIHRSLMGYRYKGSTEKPDKDGEVDHCIDCARYFWANAGAPRGGGVQTPARRLPPRSISERRLR